MSDTKRASFYFFGLLICSILASLRAEPIESAIFISTAIIIDVLKK